MCLTKTTTSPRICSISARLCFCCFGRVDRLQGVAGGAGGAALYRGPLAFDVEDVLAGADAERRPHQVDHGEPVQRRGLDAVDRIDHGRPLEARPACASGCKKPWPCRSSQQG